MFKLNQGAHRKLISGRSIGLAAAILRLFLGIAACGYSAVIRLRNYLYDKSLLKNCKAGVPVISIGNITAGGTGKTPLVIWLYNFLHGKGFQCAVLTRGYKAHPQTRATSHEPQTTEIDEPAILTESCPQAKVIVNPDRVAGAAVAVNKFDAKLLIMDDGFQHRRLARDVDIVTIDGTCPFGYGKVLPAGLLREPIAALKRVDAVVVTRCDQISDAQLSQLEEKLQQVNPDMLIARSLHATVCAKSTGNKEISLEQLRGKKIFAFCGIGNPNAFLNTIKTLGVELVGSKTYNDHHHYTEACLADIYEQAGHLNADLILTTQKDWTKLVKQLNDRTAGPKDITFAYLVIELKFLAGEDKLRGLIEDALAGKISQK